MKRVILVVAIGLGVLLLAGGGFAIWAFGSPEFPTPSGPNPVGTLQLALRDRDRTATLGAEPRGPREVGIRIWYPAAKNAQGAHLPTIDGRLAKAFSDMYSAPFGEEDGPPSASIIDASPLAGIERLPVVLFSHGGFAHRTQNVSTMEELASHGFIAIAIGHTHEALLSIFPDGRTVEMDPRLAKGMTAFAANDAGDEYLAALEKMRTAADRDAGIAAAREVGQQMAKMLEPAGRTPAELLEIRRGDIAFVIAELSMLDVNSSHPLHGRYDLEHVGVFGHSLGAHAAVSSCLDQTIPVKACVSLDTAYYLVDDQPVPTLERPVLFAHADSTTLPVGRDATMAGTDRFLRRDASAETLSVVIDGTTHMNFSDMNFLPRLMRLGGALGPIDSTRAALIANDLTVSFFRRHLMGERQEWLDAPAERFSEVQLTTN